MDGTIKAKAYWIISSRNLGRDTGYPDRGFPLFSSVSSGRRPFNTWIRQCPLLLRPLHFILHYRPIIRLYSLMTQRYPSLYPEPETLVHRKVLATVVLLFRHFAV